MSFEPQTAKIGRVVRAGRWCEKKRTGQDRKKVTKGFYFTYLWRSPHWSDVYENLCSGWCSRRNHVCQVSKRNFQGLRFYRGSNFPFFLLILNGPYNSAAPLRCLWFLSACTSSNTTLLESNQKAVLAEKSQTCQPNIATHPSPHQKCLCLYFLDPIRPPSSRYTRLSSAELQIQMFTSSSTLFRIKLSAVHRRTQQSLHVTFIIFYLPLHI